MKLTNKFGYHPTIVKAIENDSYSKGDSEFSATGLLQPARIRVLTEKYRDQIELDVDDHLFKLYGLMGHTILERAGESHLVEKRFFGDVDGVKISAQIDSLSLSDGILTDWKFTTVYQFMKGRPPKWDWVMQMNIQLELLRQNGMDANGLQIVGLLRDWSLSNSKKIKDYPNKIGVHQIEMFPREKTIEFIRSRIKAHRDADIELPFCTSVDNWNGNRCESYCEVSKFCDQYKQQRRVNGVSADKKPNPIGW